MIVAYQGEYVGHANAACWIDGFLLLQVPERGFRDGERGPVWRTGESRQEEERDTDPGGPAEGAHAYAAPGRSREKVGLTGSVGGEGARPDNTFAFITGSVYALKDGGPMFIYTVIKTFRL